jgi:phage gpG-like protein
MAYTNMMQFGGTKSQFPHLWGDIPARPFVGVSDADKAAILDVISRRLEATGLTEAVLLNLPKPTHR